MSIYGDYGSSTSIIAWTPYFLPCQHQWQTVAKLRHWAGSNTMYTPDWYGYHSRIEECWLCHERREVAE
jgi:hypothetical protein